MTEIIDHLYLGNCLDAKTIHQEICLDLIVNVTLDIPFYSHIYNIRVPIDNNSKSIVPEFETALMEMAEILEETKNIVIYCDQNNSKSASLIIAYLIK
jgi:hypothetical protein